MEKGHHTNLLNDIQCKIKRCASSVRMNGFDEQKDRALEACKNIDFSKWKELLNDEQQRNITKKAEQCCGKIIGTNQNMYNQIVDNEKLLQALKKFKKYFKVK